ncbi:hypothetical protein BKA70DRAFT_1034916, partial [Coprinopsis sp. MPI-PUGE-AT-0042]
DALDSAYFLHHAAAVMFNGDMLGSAKVNGLVGHVGWQGDRFSLVPGARNAIGGKAQYYPLSPPENEIYNDFRPPDFSTASSIPLRTQAGYWKSLEYLSNPRLTDSERQEYARKTGVSRMPLAVVSPCFIHPAFFPLDPFHLFYENCMPF